MTMLNYTAHHPNGYIEVTDPEMPMVEAETLQCCHCGKHWQVQPGSGTKRGFCFKCNQVHCGGRSCWECKPQEKVLEEIEAIERLRTFALQLEARQEFSRALSRLKG